MQISSKQLKSIQNESKQFTCKKSNRFSGRLWKTSDTLNYFRSLFFTVRSSEEFGGVRRHIPGSSEEFGGVWRSWEGYSGGVWRSSEEFGGYFEMPKNACVLEYFFWPQKNSWGPGKLQSIYLTLLCYYECLIGCKHALLRPKPETWRPHSLRSEWHGTAGCYKDMLQKRTQITPVLFSCPKEQVITRDVLQNCCTTHGRCLNTRHGHCDLGFLGTSEED